MPMQRQVIEVPLTAGLNEKADVRSLAINGAAQMTNCVMQSTGAVRKRFGNAALASLGAVVAGGSYKAAPPGSQTGPRSSPTRASRPPGKT